MLRNRIPNLALLLCLAALPAAAQATGVISASYYLPGLSQVAPGQVVPVYVRGLNIPTTVARTMPIPSSLAGVRVSATSAPAGVFSGDLPVVAITPVACTGPGIICNLTAIVVQMPTEVRSCSVPATALVASACDQTLTLTVSSGGSLIGSLDVLLVSSQVKPLDTCTVALEPVTGYAPVNGNCGMIITHADGSVVAANRPIHPGEELVVYALGIGYGTAGIPRGTPAPAPVPLPSDLVHAVALVGDDSVIRSATAANPPAADYAGLVAGQVGLYQINVHVPDTIPASAPSCTTGHGKNGILNIRVEQLGFAADICIEPEVNRSSREQAHGIAQIGQALAQIERVTRTAAATAEESAAASEQLSAHSEALHRVVDR